MTTVLVTKQSVPQETRVPLLPAAVAKLVGRGLDVMVESGAGMGAFAADEEYRKAGAQLVPAGDGGAWSKAEVVLTIHAPSEAQVRSLKRGAVLVGMLAPLKNAQVVLALADAGVTSFSAEFVPRISRAQSMDVLSSQANIAGYKAVMLAANACPKLFPQLMTAAGTITPAKVFVLGVGVAGLQAIATAKRLGAVIEAYDVRLAVKDQVQSLGAKFVELPTTSAEAETAGGYAKQQTEEQRNQQIQLMAKHVAAADAVITTAAVFGKAPPLLVPADMVRAMAPGSVIVDMAADVDCGRGNCELTQPGRRIVTENGVIIDGTLNLPALVPVHASQVYAANMLAFLSEIVPPPVKGTTEPPQVKINLEDEIQKGAAITHGGQIVNAMVREALAS